MKMIARRVRRTGPALLLFLALTSRLAAHHSHGNYNMTEYTTLTGIVKEVHWINPHTWIYLEVKDDKGEPIVCSPRDALRTFYSTGIDALAIGSCLIEKPEPPLYLKPTDVIR